MEALVQGMILPTDQLTRLLLLLCLKQVLRDTGGIAVRVSKTFAFRSEAWVQGRGSSVSTLDHEA